MWAKCREVKKKKVTLTKISFQSVEVLLVKLLKIFHYEYSYFFLFAFDKMVMLL